MDLSDVSRFVTAFNSDLSQVTPRGGNALKNEEAEKDRDARLGRVFTDERRVESRLSLETAESSLKALYYSRV